MNIDPNRLTVRRLTDFAAVETLYRERMKKDFARNELRPLANLRRSWERDAYDCYGLFRGEEILGYAFFVRLGGNYLFDYLAIAGEHRDEGLGSAFLRLLAGCFGAAIRRVRRGLSDPGGAHGKDAHDGRTAGGLYRAVPERFASRLLSHTVSHAVRKQSSMDEETRKRKADLIAAVPFALFALDIINGYLIQGL